MELEPLQDGWSRAIRAVFGAVIGLALATVAWMTDASSDGPSFVVLATGLALVFALGMAAFGDAFWRAIRDGAR